MVLSFQSSTVQCVYPHSYSLFEVVIDNMIIFNRLNLFQEEDMDDFEDNDDEDDPEDIVEDFKFDDWS